MTVYFLIHSLHVCKTRHCCSPACILGLRRGLWAAQQPPGHKAYLRRRPYAPPRRRASRARPLGSHLLRACGSRLEGGEERRRPRGGGPFQERGGKVPNEGVVARGGEEAEDRGVVRLLELPYTAPAEVKVLGRGLHNLQDLRAS